MLQVLLGLFPLSRYIHIYPNSVMHSPHFYRSQLLPFTIYPFTPADRFLAKPWRTRPAQPKLEKKTSSFSALPSIEHYKKCELLALPFFGVGLVHLMLFQKKYKKNTYDPSMSSVDKNPQNEKTGRGKGLFFFPHLPFPILFGKCFRSLSRRSRERKHPQDQLAIRVYMRKTLSNCAPPVTILAFV